MNSSKLLSPQDAMSKILRGLSEVYTAEDLKNKFENSAKTGKQLRVKFGADPSRPDLHLGHSVQLRKLRQFQDFGHKVILIIGDFTAMIGDPSGRSKTRPALTLQETRDHGRSYQEQATKILDSDPAKLEVHYNSEWLEPLGAAGLIQLAQSQTVAQILQRDDFAKRYSSNIPIGVHELLYPILQAYDSVAIKADIEFGGTDQTFNCLMGRELQKQRGLEPQVVLILPILAGLDGKDKMSKSLDNYIGITEPAETIYKKTMTVPDNLLLQYIELCTDLDLTEAKERMQQDAYETHKWLACELVRLYHGAAEIEAAEKRYATVATGVAPESMPQVIVERAAVASATGAATISLVQLTTTIGLTASKGEARRLTANGGLKVDGQKITDPNAVVSMAKSIIIQRGKDKFMKVIFK